MAESFITQAKALMTRLDDEPDHPLQVAFLSLQLFDALAPLHAFGQKARNYLEAAALLHDIGWFSGQKGHHKKSMKMILEQTPEGWTELDKLVVANIARYHRKALPAEKHTNYALLSADNKESVNKLAALLRLADGLDRSHMAKIKKVNAVIEKKQVALSITGSGDLSEEIAGFHKKKDLFERTYARSIVIREQSLTI